MPTAVSILFHLFYKDSIKTFPSDLINDFSVFDKLSVNFIFNNVSEVNYTYCASNVSGSVFYAKSTNKGKDIGGKFALLDLCNRLNLNSDYYILIHDKHSPHTTLGEEWRKKLFRII